MISQVKERHYMYLSLLVITYKHGQRFKAYTGTTFCIILLTPFLNIKGNKTMLCHQFLWKTIYLHNCPWNGKLKKSWWHLLMNVLELGQGKSYKITVFVMNYLKSSWFRLGIGYSIPGHILMTRYCIINLAHTLSSVMITNYY